MSPTDLVIGAGVGGISAAPWLRDRQVTFDWVEASDSIGGTLRRVGNPIDELAGLKAHSGVELVTRYRTQLQQLALGPRYKVRVEHIAPLPHDRLRAHFEGGSVADYDAILLCTGTRPRMLNLPHEDALLGRGVEVSVTRTRERYRNQRVAVVGGGDAALEGLLLLSEVTDELHLIHRRSTFRAQARFVRKVQQNPKITLHLNEQVQELIPKRRNALSRRHLRADRRRDAISRWRVSATPRKLSRIGSARAWRDSRTLYRGRCGHCASSECCMGDGFCRARRAYALQRLTRAFWQLTRFLDDHARAFCVPR